MKRWKLSWEMLRRAASGHIEAMQLSKFAAASRIALAVISGWPEAPSSPLHDCEPPVDGAWVPAGEPAWPDFEDPPPKMLLRKSSGPLADCAGAGADPKSAAASTAAPVRPIERLKGRVIFHPRGFEISLGGFQEAQLRFPLT